MEDLKANLITEKAYTKKEVAELLHVTTMTINNYIKANKLKTIKVGARHVLIPKASLDEFIDKYTKVI